MNVQKKTFKQTTVPSKTIAGTSSHQRTDPFTFRSSSLVPICNACQSCLLPIAQSVCTIDYQASRNRAKRRQLPKDISINGYAKKNKIGNKAALRVAPHVAVMAL